MALIKLLILDDDEEYSFNLCTFLTHNYSETLLVNYYNNSFKIEEWIKKIDPDIILISEKFYNQVHNSFNGNIVILSPGTNFMNISEFPTIYKYKDANQIAGDIINIYTKSRNIITKVNEKSVKTVAVYSAAGNAGKTSIALGISTVCSYSGLSVFYINLEQFQSTNIFFFSDIEHSISDIIYYSKERDKNLASKISTMSCKDVATNVHFFKETNNAFEINELFPSDIQFIIDTMKACGEYDLIVVDMGTQLNENAISLFEIADEILYVLTEEEICLHKTKSFIDSINMLSNQTSLLNSFTQKFHYVVNKASNQALQIPNFLPEASTISKIPFDKNFTSVRNLIKLNGGPDLVYSAFKNIAQRYI